MDALTLLEKEAREAAEVLGESMKAEKLFEKYPSLKGRVRVLRNQILLYGDVDEVLDFIGGLDPSEWQVRHVAAFPDNDYYKHFIFIVLEKARR